LKRLGGLVAVVSGETARFARAEDALNRMKLPPSWEMRRFYGTNVACNLNNGVRYALATGADYLLVIGDDHVFPASLVYHLLSRNVDIVAPLVTFRRPPYAPIAFRDRKEGAYMWETIPWDTLPSEGLMEVAAVTNSGMLMRRSVLEALQDPWFDLGQVHPEHTSEDLHFCEKARACGFRVYLDVDMTLEHLTPIGVKPTRREDGRWGMDAVFDDGIIVALPLSLEEQELVPA
jgi:hypothetical protein